jgi:hypothetical protein
MMDTVTTTIQLPADIYAEIETFAAEEQSDLNTLLVSMIRRSLEARKWQKGWRELHEMIQRDGGLPHVGNTTEEIVEHMRKTRQEVFEAEYAHLYR